MDWNKKPDMELVSINSAIHRILDFAQSHMSEEDYVNLLALQFDSDFQNTVIPCKDGYGTKRTFEIQQTILECWRTLEKTHPYLIKNFWNNRI